MLTIGALYVSGGKSWFPIFDPGTTNIVDFYWTISPYTWRYDLKSGMWSNESAAVQGAPTASLLDTVNSGWLDCCSELHMLACRFVVSIDGSKS
jgi:hypothetical protein